MKKNKKKAFTLVELLAVIVILAVILIIAIPQIMDTIKTTRLKTMEDSAKLIATNAEKDYLSQQAINQNYKAISIPCTDVAKLSKDYASCTITYNSNGVATVKLKGADGSKFDGITCTGTKDNMNCRNSSASEVIYALGWPERTLTYDIDYDKCMEFFSESPIWTDSDKELFCTDKVTSQGFSIKKDLNTNLSNGTSSPLIEEGIVTNVVIGGYEQITDYNSLNSNVFVRYPKGEEVYDDSTPKSVCIKYKGKTNNEINCFEYDNYEYEKQHLADVFGKDKCTGTDVDSLALLNNPLFNKILGIEKVYASQEPEYVAATDDKFRCGVEKFGPVWCKYGSKGYRINSNGKVDIILPSH
jgi:prepilin-type N-terminal cleavage/methylation domain-containing protein